MLEWIMDGDLQEEPTFLLRRDGYSQITGDYRFRGWQRADVSGIIEAAHGVARLAEEGEHGDRLSVFVLTDVGPVPVAMSSAHDVSVGFVEVTLTWSNSPFRERRSLSGFYPQIGA